MFECKCHLVPVSCRHECFSQCNQHIVVSVIITFFSDASASSPLALIMPALRSRSSLLEVYSCVTAAACDTRYSTYNGEDVAPFKFPAGTTESVMHL